MAEYYKQRVAADLIITEGVYPSEDGRDIVEHLELLKNILENCNKLQI